MKQKYFKTKSAAMKACAERNANHSLLAGAYRVFRMPKGSRKAGWFAVCTDLEYLNTY